MNRPAIALAALAVATVGDLPTARAGDDDALLDIGVIFARDHSLWRTDAKGKGPPTEIAQLAGAAADVRALRTDAAGKVLLADLGGTWAWMPLDGTTTALAPLPCTGPASLAPDGSCALCADDHGNAVIFNFARGKRFALTVPAAGAAITVAGTDRRLVWSDGGLWSAPPGKLTDRRAVAPESPLRALSIAPDGSRALGVYPGEIHDSRKTTRPAEILVQFALDGTAARRKTIRDATPVAWSHDSQWVLLQDGSTACVARAVGGEYKCWKGYTAVSIAPDGAWALLLGPRRGDSGDAGKAKGGDAGKAKGGDADPAPAKPAGASAEGEAGGDDEDDASSAGGASLPSGPLSLYRGELAGAFADPPILVEKIVDGAAVWLPPPSP